MPQITRARVFETEGPIFDDGIEVDSMFASEPSLEMMILNYYKSLKVYTDQEAMDLTKQYISEWLNVNG